MNFMQIRAFKPKQVPKQVELMSVLVLLNFLLKIGVLNKNTKLKLRNIH